MEGNNDYHLIDINEKAKIRKVSFCTTGPWDPGVSFFLGGGHKNSGNQREGAEEFYRSY